MEIRSCYINTMGLCEVKLDALNRVTDSDNAFVAIGDWTDGGNEPCVWFSGGSAFTDQVKNAPTMQFNIFGECNVVFYEWMSEYNCPHAYNDRVIRQVERFVQRNLPILFLVYYRYLDKEDVVAYFEGAMDWDALLSSMWRLVDIYYTGILTCENTADLHSFCVSQGLYGAEEAAENSDKPLLCEALLRHGKPVFEIEYDGAYETLIAYHGDKETVWLPSQIQRIDDLVFYMHDEIKTIYIPNQVTVFGWDVFYGCPDVTIICEEGSRAEEYAKDYDIPYRYVGD